MKWIPTSERLPSERGEYLVTVDFEGDTYVECFHYGKPIMANREVKDECFYDSDDEWGDVVYDTGTEVIAWMPLPEPYTADRKTEPQIFICPIQDDYEALIEDEPQTMYYPQVDGITPTVITEDRDTQILDAWQVKLKAEQTEPSGCWVKENQGKQICDDCIKNTDCSWK